VGGRPGRRGIEAKTAAGDLAMTRLRERMFAGDRREVAVGVLGGEA
jgi:hypothetical protein